MPKPRRRETDDKIFVAGLKDHPDDLIISMAVMNRMVTPTGEYGRLTRDALTAEAEWRYVDAGGTKDEFVRDQDEILQGRGGP
jgi:hypothetical protein